MIILEFPSESKDVFNELIEHSPSSVVFAKKGNLSGTADLSVAMITAAGAIAPFVTKIVIEMLRTKRKISLKCKGIEVRGLSEETAKEIITRLMDGKNAN
ncbi:hypothetical protein [Azospirillum argentinense]